MKLIGTVPFAEVLEVYRGDHPVDRAHVSNTNQDGEDVLHMADELLGTWHRVLLSRDEVLGIVLPWHLSEGGGRELVPRSGRTVGEAAELVRSGGAEMAAANPICSEKLQLFGERPLTPVYLSTRPVPHTDYSDLEVRTGLIHLDGLHRTVAWALHERLSPDERTEAFVAGAPDTAPAG
ncbi:MULTISPECIES: DUF6309 family protein [unclassified Nocardiopsis]|jgi:hypothetical protein|uniref:DUF6309 family protein n=1 Tax=unclassified Nocardiopsis TaxID=2649073 RepID=UPI00066CBCF7|nr:MULTISPECIES: DUF6309 family protein [unclassified Nocardiopsis]MBQ1082075.1 hypothetical protein [Nocardiopsis sp. B62]